MCCVRDEVFVVLNPGRGRLDVPTNLGKVRENGGRGLGIHP